MGGLESLLPLVLIFVVFYFLLIRPQQKKQKEHKAMLEALRRGDRILTSGGIMGTITKVQSENELIVEIAEGIKVRVARGMVADVMSKTEGREAANDDNSDDTEDGEEEKTGNDKK
jgi:preprotein translocase subunit YajC